MKRSAAPFLGSDVGDRLSEVPAVAVKILGVVLALSIRVVLWFRQNHGSVLPRPFVMTLRIFNSNLNYMRVVRRNRPFSDGEAAIPGLHLDAVIRDAQTHLEAEGL